MKQCGHDDYESDGSKTSAHDDNTDSRIVLKEKNESCKTCPHSDNLQKTGFYYKQRMDQQTVASLCANKDALGLCCFSGSFSFRNFRR